MKLKESAENYLETILILGQNGNPVRPVDIANELDYTKPSVSVAIKKLRSEGYIASDTGGFIILTEKGRKIAESMYERHTLISDWLIFLGVDTKTAVSDACRLEHAMSEQTFSAIRSHIEEWKQHIYKQKN